MQDNTKSQITSKTDRVRRATVYHPDGTIEVHWSNDMKRHELSELQGWVGGLVELVRGTRTGVDVWVNEEGLIDGLPLNYPGSLAAQKLGARFDGILSGPVVITDIVIKPSQLPNQPMEVL